MKSSLVARLQVILSMVIFGTIGLFRRFLPLPSGAIACARGLIGAAFLLVIRLFIRKPIDRATIKKALPWLIASGAAIGFNWILLFEAYNYTSVATATLCYYMAPIIVIVAAPFLLRERLSLKKGLCAAVAVLGIVGVSGVLDGGLPSGDEALGIVFGLGAAVLYASVMLMGRKLSDLAALDKTILQLGTAGVVLIPYCFITGWGNVAALPWELWLLLFGVGIVHTGVAYLCYFGGMGKLPAQTTAILSYIDPVLAVLLSALVLHEHIGVFGIVGAVLVLGAALVSELPEKRAKENTYESDL